MVYLTVFPLSVPEQGVRLSGDFPILIVFGYILLFVGILALAYGSTRMVGRAYDRTKHGSQIQVTDRRLLAQDKSIIVVKVVDQYYVMYTDRSRTVLLDKLSDYPDKEQREEYVSFQHILNRFQKPKKDSNV